MAAISQEDSAAAEEVSAATEEMSAQVEEVVASAATLADMAGTLDGLVGRFTLAGHEGLAAEIEVFKKAHLKWVDRIRGFLAGHDRIALSDIPDHHGCALGKWYYGIGRIRVGSLPAYSGVEGPHARFHDALRTTVAANDRGDRRAADGGAADVDRISREVVDVLTELARQGAGAAAPVGPPSAVRRARAA